MRHLRDRRLLGLASLALAWATIVGGLWFTRHVAPDGDQRRIAGFAIGEGYERTTIPRRALSCTNPNGDRYRERCSVTIEGRLLTAEIAHDDHDYNFASCLVRYGDREGSCWATGTPTNAAMSRVGLGLSTETVEALARQRPLDNWREADWLRAASLATTIIAASLTLAALLLLPLRFVGRAAAASCLGFLTWGFGRFFALVALLLNGLVD
jgi:hypothetical protein